MKKRMFRKILTKLRLSFGRNAKGHAIRRIKKLAAFICGILRKKRPHMSALGSGLPQMITAHSREKAAKKFLENTSWINFDTYYLPYVSSLLKQIIAAMPNNEDIKIVIDGSKMGNAHMALMVSIIYKGRGIPIAWLVRKKPKGHFDSKTHVDLIKQVHQILEPLTPETKAVVLLGDGEFDNIDLQEFCRSKGWGYVFRTACNSVFYKGETRFQPKDLDTQPNQDFISFPNVRFTEKQFKNVHLVYWHDKKYDTPLPLVSNLGDPKQITKAYDQRYSIEGMFKDLKSTTFFIHKTRLKSASAISNLIMVAAFAFTLLVKIGVKYENSPLRPYFNRLRPDRPVNTFITFARDFIDFCFDEGFDFSFSFHFSNNSS